MTDSVAPVKLPAPRPAPALPRSGLLQRKCACGGTPGPSGECAACRARRLGVQRQAADPGLRSVPPIVHDVLRAPGQPLDAATRAFMEPRFGHDFSTVRVHADDRAGESAGAVNALAYTVAQHVVFAPGRYGPDTADGRRLLAHELAHVVQQAGAPAATSLAIGPADDPAEQAAARTARSLEDTRGDTGPAVTPRLQRLGANPACTPAETRTIHEAIFNARGWLNKAIPQLEARPLPAPVVASLRRNFGPTYGVAVNADLITGRLRRARSEVSTIPFGCAGAADATCATLPCGFAHGAGGHAATICSNVTLVAGTDWRYQAGCVLHESLHAAYSGFTIDEYSGWHGASGSTATYPGTGTDPLLNADSYTTLVMDLS